MVCSRQYYLYQPDTDSCCNSQNEAAECFSITQYPFPVRKILSQINGGTSPDECSNRIRGIRREHDPDRGKQRYYEQLNTNNVALQYL